MTTPIFENPPGLEKRVAIIVNWEDPEIDASLKEVTKNFNSDLSGIIVVAKVETKGYFYLHANELFSKFDDATHSECPYQSSQWWRIAKKIKQTQNEDHFTLPFKVYPALWIHSECAYSPLDKYLQMSGGQYPGSPKQ